MVSAGSRRVLVRLVAAAAITVAAPAHADDPVPAPAGAAADPAGTPLPEPPKADEPPPVPKLGVRRKDATLSEIMRGPYRSSRLFAMPIADVVGAYQLSVSGDGSLLQEQGILSAAGAIAIGFGDLAQLEFRHTAAITVEGGIAPLPSLGVQIKLPLPEKRYVPSFAVAFRYGLQRERTVGTDSIKESVTDGYIVSRLALWGFAEGASIHAGVRISQADLLVGARANCEDELRCLKKDDQYVVLPTFGLDFATDRGAHLIVEAGLAPQFRYDVKDGDPMPSARVERGILGRIGVRWYLHPAFSVDASMGYQLEVAGSSPVDDLTDLIRWDIRLGAEFFVPWGAFVCKGMGAFCD